MVGEEVSTDSDGNVYWHLYEHEGSSPNSVDLTPDTTNGALFAGMSADGSRVFFTTPDQLLPVDTDHSADIYEADVEGGSATLSLVSRKGSSASNSDACAPAGTVPWNKVSGRARLLCSGVCRRRRCLREGTIYFLSPEVLDGAAAADQANVYILRPGQDPKFVATIDTSVGKPASLRRPGRCTEDFLTGLSNPESLAIDESNGDVYVTEAGAGRVARYTSAGSPTTSRSPAAATASRASNWAGPESEIAVDNAPASPLEGDLYVRKNAGTVGVYAPSGEEVGHISGFNEACGIAIDQSTGVVYVGDYSFGGIHRLEPSSPSGEITNADYVETGLSTAGMNPCQVAADSAGHVYASSGRPGPSRSSKHPTSRLRRPRKPAFRSRQRASRFTRLRKRMSFT